MASLLIVDRDPSYLRSTSSLWQKNFKVFCAESVSGALATLSKQRVNVVLVEFELAEQDGFDFFGKVKSAVDPDVPIVVLCSAKNIDRAAEVIHHGATDFSSRDIDPILLVEKISRANRLRELETQLHVLQAGTAELHDKFVFASDVMKQVHNEIARLAGQDFDILLIGETGVGKDLIAFELHRRSSRANKPFVTLPMRSLSETLIESEIFGHEKGAFSGASAMKVGKLEAAHRGTLYIPEVTSLTESTQLKLLHFLQYKTITRVGQDARKPSIPVNVKIIFATNKNASEEMAKGNLRADFYYRISGVKISVPPLRQRLEDIEPLVDYFIAKHVSPTLSRPTLAPGVLDALKMHRWPGNVRELENSVKEMVAESEDGVLKLPGSLPHTAKGTLTEQCEFCLGTYFKQLPEYAEAETQFKRAYFSSLLRRTGNNISLAAPMAGMTPQGLRKALHVLGLRHD